MSTSERLIQYNERRLPHERRSICHAPFINLNFEQSGNATACCYNRQFILGKYPKNSLDEIWRGEKAQQLRKLMEASDFSRGCGLCLHQLKAGNFAGMLAKYYDSRSNHGRTIEATSDPILRIIELEISNVCNLECIMCNGYFSSAIRKNRERLEPTQNVYDLKFVEQLRAFMPQLWTMKFLGGEPFLNSLYFEIWESLIELNPAVNTIITTNGTVLNERAKRVISRLKPAMTLSLESLDPVIYRQIRKNGELSDTLENMKFFDEVCRSGGKRLSIATCPMVQNWQGLPDIYKLCRDNRYYLGINTVIWPPHCSLKNLPNNDLVEIADLLSQSISDQDAHSKDPIVANNWRSFTGMINQIRLWTSDHDRQIQL